MSFRDAATAKIWCKRFEALDIAAAGHRIAQHTLCTPLVPLPAPIAGLELRGKLENQQITGAFKARGAWNNVAQLDAGERRRGVVTASSGNHGRALAWAARHAGVAATVVIPCDAYPNKIEACRAYGATVVLAETRAEADNLCAEFVADGKVLVHPYDALPTIEGAGTVGLEIAGQWPEVETVLIPVGGGGLAAGVALALRRAFGASVRIYGVEPRGAQTLSCALQAGAPVHVEQITSSVQGLCPSSAGILTSAICAEALDGVLLVEDAEIFASQATLIAAGQVVEPAGAAAHAALAHLPPPRGRVRVGRVAIVLSGANGEPAQIAGLDRSERP